MSFPALHSDCRPVRHSGRHWQKVHSAEALGGDHFPTGCFRFLIGHICIVEAVEPSICHPLVEIDRQIFGNIPVEQHPQDILLEVPAINASTKVIGYVPYGAVKGGGVVLFSVGARVECDPDSVG